MPRSSPARGRRRRDTGPPGASSPLSTTAAPAAPADAAVRRYALTPLVLRELSALLARIPAASALLTIWLEGRGESHQHWSLTIEQAALLREEVPDSPSPAARAATEPMSPTAGARGTTDGTTATASADTGSPN